MAVEGLDQGYRAFEQRHDDRGVHVEGKRRRRARRLEPTRSTFNDRLRDNEHVGVDFALRLSTPFAFSRVIDLARVVSSASLEPMRFRPSHGKDAVLTPLRIPLR
jgi:hypothetical protein